MRTLLTYLKINQRCQELCFRLWFWAAAKMDDFLSRMQATEQTAKKLVCHALDSHNSWSSLAASKAKQKDRLQSFSFPRCDLMESQTLWTFLGANSSQESKDFNMDSKSLILV